MDNLTEVNCLHSEKKTCLRSVVISALKQEIKKSESLLGEDSEINAIALEDIKDQEAAINLTCQDCPLNKQTVKENFTSSGKPVMRKIMTSKEAQRFAREHGWVISRGHGRHGVRLVGPDGQFTPLSDHPGLLSIGLCQKIVKQMIGSSVSQHKAFA